MTMRTPITVLSINVFEQYPPGTRMADILRQEAAAGRRLSNNLRTAGISRRKGKRS